MGELSKRLESIAISATCKEEGQRIGLAIKNTWDNNWRWRIPRVNDERAKGYYCYDWAYSFEDAFNLESSGKCFKATVEQSATPDGRVHFWLYIQSLETGQSVYVDDGFWNDSNVHAKRPYGGDYGFTPGTCDIPREKANPPVPRDAEKNPYPRGPRARRPHLPIGKPYPTF